jgi:hypothetical protein
MKTIFSLVLISCFYFNALSFDKRYTQQEYISQWKDVAMLQMQVHQIPASITLAQGILESGYGNSDLALKANNHFGIKCGDWKGETFSKDDNLKNECFRKYIDAKDSYEDHSTFLKKSRYSFLYTYDVKDYKSWANGLKQAGYATNPKYPQLLIDLIERIELYKFDQGSDSQLKPIEVLTIKSSSSKRNIMRHANDINYVIAKKGDTYYRLSKELSISLWQLYKYNEFGDNKDCLEEGDIIYLEPKKRKSSIKNELILNEDLSLRIVSQKEGVKIKKLLKFNNLSSADITLNKGYVVRLK